MFSLLDSVSIINKLSKDPQNRLAYSTSEVAQLLGVSPRSLKRLEERGLLRPSRGLRKKLYLDSDLVAYLEDSK